MKRYIAIDLLALKQYKLSLEEWTLLENIYFMSNNEFGYCYASKNTLRDIIQVSNGQIYKIINRLIEDKFLIKNSDTGYLKVTQKWINISSGEGIQKMESESPKNGKQPIQKMETKKDNIKRDIKKEEKNIKKDLDLDAIQDEVFEETDLTQFPVNKNSFKEWIEFRKEIKKPITRLTAKKQFKLLCCYPEDTQAEIINFSIQNSYQGLFAPKQNKFQSQPQKTKDQIRREQIDKHFADLYPEKETYFDFDGEIVE